MDFGRGYQNTCPWESSGWSEGQTWGIRILTPTDSSILQLDPIILSPDFDTSALLPFQKMGFVRIWQLISNSCSKDRESMVYVWNVLFSHHIWSDNYQTRWKSIHYCLSNQLHSISFRNINNHLSQVSNLILCRIGIIIGCSMLDCIGLCVKWDCLFLWNKHIFHHFITFSRSLDF